MRARSRNAFAPAHTVITGWWASASRSALTSPVSFGAAVHAADAAGGEDLDPGRRRERERRRDGGRAELPPLRHGDREIAFSGLARRSEDPLVLGLVEPDPCNAVEHRRERRHRAAGADRSRAPDERLGVGR